MSLATLRIGVVGLGSMGRRHAETCLKVPGVRLAAVATRHPDRQDQARRLGAEVFDDYRDLVGRVDGVIVAVPTVLHGEVAGFFLERRIPTLVEKPIAATEEDGERLVKLAADTETPLMVGHIERFNPAYQAFARWATEQRLLETGPIHIQGHRMGIWDGRISDVGVVADLMVHDVDLMLGLFGKSPDSIEALGSSIVSVHDDLAVARLSFGSSGSAHLLANRIAAERRRGLVLYYEGGRVFVDFINQEVVVVPKGSEQGTPIPVEKAPPLDGQLATFAACIRNKRQPQPDARQALSALSICEQIRKQVWSSCPSLSIPIA